MASKSTPSLLRKLLDELIVFDSSSLRKVRVGSKYDGGYVVPDYEIPGVDFLYSGGVGNNLDFEFDFRARSRAQIKMFDPTIPTPHYLPAGAEFYPVGLGMNGHSLMSLFRYGSRPNLSRHRTWLKIDIEGWEWPAVESTSLECLELFEVLIVEFHDMTNTDDASIRQKTAALAKINRRFRLIHVHGNNYSPFNENVQGTLLPYCLEATYLRKDLLPGRWYPNRSPFPGPLDSPCNPWSEDLDLTCWPFVHKRRAHRAR